jgi:mannose-6-phosphate isomerase-like protein (cupin superfamily)
MSIQIRRIITGHNQEGRAVVASDEVLRSLPVTHGVNIEGCEIGSTNQMPVDNSPSGAAAQKAGFVRHYNYVGTGGGSTFEITEFAPGHTRFAHRTETMDYAIVLSGEIDMELEGDEAVHLKTGDVVVQRGTIHTWANIGTVPAVLAFIMIDALPVEINGELKRTFYPSH